MPFTSAEKLVMLGIPSDAAKEIAAAALAGTSLKPQITAIIALTDSSGGAATDTLEVIPAAAAATTDTTAASLASVTAMRTAIQNDFADLAAKVNAILAALKA